MKTKESFCRARVVVVAGALLTTVFASGCITHPPGKPAQQTDTSKETKKPRHQKSAITHPPGGSRDHSKEGPLETSPAPITHPGG